MRKIKFETGSRIYIISDIHGGLHLLKELLEKVKAGHKLIILGDLIEKGANSLQTLEYIMELSKLDNIYIIKGNNDDSLVNIFKNERIDYFSNRMKNKTSIIYEIIQRHGLNGCIEEMFQYIKEEYKSYLDWIDKLETMIETDDFIFVHAGIDNIPDYWNTPINSQLRLSNFYLKGHQANKYVVCGHYPTVNFSVNDFCDNIIIDHDKKIICMDGGYAAKTTGQLNMLEIINNNNNYIYKTYVADDYQEFVITNDQEAKGNSRGINYPDYEISIINEGLYFSKVKTVNGEEVYIKNELINFMNSHYYSKDDTPNNLLEVKKGDIVKLIRNDTLGYALIKKDGISGWVSYDCLPDNIRKR